MKIEYLSVRKVIVLPNGETEEVLVQASIEDGEDAEQAYKNLRGWVESQKKVIFELEKEREGEHDRLFSQSSNLISQLKMSAEEGKEMLLSRYGKRGRSQLILSELRDFVNYLQELLDEEEREEDEEDEEVADDEDDDEYKTADF